MNTIQVLTFGRIADITGLKNFEVQDVATTGDLLLLLEEKHPGLKQQQYAVAVNMELVQEPTALPHQAIVALLPPFSGG